MRLCDNVSSSCALAIVAIGNIHSQEGKSFIVIRPNVTRGGYADNYAAHLEETARLLEAPAVIASAR